jgi:hypothetical protein
MFGLDSIELEPVHLLRANAQDQWLDHIEADSPTLLQKVERLELKCHYWEEELEINHNAGDFFKRFSGLKVLLLTIILCRQSLALVLTQDKSCMPLTVKFGGT